MYIREPIDLSKLSKFSDCISIQVPTKQYRRDTNKLDHEQRQKKTD